MTDLQKDELYFIPLGGSEQFGVNLNVYAYDGQFLAVDCGIGFADERMPGIDILLPDPAFLVENKKKLAGMIVTHAHEDHVGAVAHLWPRLRCPVYCTKFTAAVLQDKINENPDCKGMKIQIIGQNDFVQIGPFKTHFIPVSHSIPETSSLIIETEKGLIVHTGDWNLDPAPALGPVTDPEPFKAAGKKGVLAYIGDSTNAEVDGVSGSESDVAAGLEKVFKDLDDGLIAITIFASNIGRIRSIALAAKACGRSVGVMGRSLHRMIGAARHCGYLKDVPEFVAEEDFDLIPRDNLVIIVTGSQGEARAQLARLSRGDNPRFELQKGDTVIFSSRAIPGNEKEIITVKNNLAAGGVKTISPRDTEHCIHVSGHPARDEITQMLQWLKPVSAIPVHGERTMLEAHAELARGCQVKSTVVPNNGSVIQIGQKGVKIVDHIETGLLAVEPGRIIEAGHSAISERRKLQFSGSVHVTIVLDGRGEIMGDPQISTVGLVDTDESEGRRFEKALLREVEDILDEFTQDEIDDEELISEEIRIGVRRLVNNMIRIKPKTTVHVVRV